MTVLYRLLYVSTKDHWFQLNKVFFSVSGFGGQRCETGSQFACDSRPCRNGGECLVNLFLLLNASKYNNGNVR